MIAAVVQSYLLLSGALVHFQFHFSIAASSWSYVKLRDGKPVSAIEDWARLPGSMCSGASQSPINIDTSSVLYDARLKKVQFQVVDLDSTPSTLMFSMINDGHKIQLNQNNPNKEIQMRFGDEGGVYILAQIHFHWGADSSRGSEHLINGRAYPFEAHFVTYNKQFYSSFTEASKAFNGLAVLAVLFDVTDSGNPSIEEMVRQFTGTFLEAEDSSNPPTRKLEQFDYTKLLPSNMDAYYRYMGSLTTPNCGENVLWTVLSTPATMTEKQLKRFTDLKFSSNLGPMVDNFRPVLPLNPSHINTTYFAYRTVLTSGGVASTSWTGRIGTGSLITSWFTGMCGVVAFAAGRVNLI